MNKDRVAKCSSASMVNVIQQPRFFIENGYTAIDHWIKSRLKMFFIYEELWAFFLPRFGKKYLRKVT